MINSDGISKVFLLNVNKTQTLLFDPTSYYPRIVVGDWSSPLKLSAIEEKLSKLTFTFFRLEDVTIKLCEIPH